MARKRVAFVSGHLNLTEDEFRQHYIPLIDEAIQHGDAFVVGDAPGADKMAQDYLKTQGQDAMVYHMLQRPRNNAGFVTIGGFTSNTGKDEAMTNNSDYDIAWVRPGKENSGTARNLQRRAKITGRMQSYTGVKTRYGTIAARPGPKTYKSFMDDATISQPKED